MIVLPPPPLNHHAVLGLISFIRPCIQIPGLSLILNIEASEYLDDFSESYGAIIDVTASNEMYFPEENGYLVAPGQVTNIGFSKVGVILPLYLYVH